MELRDPPGFLLRNKRQRGFKMWKVGSWRGRKSVNAYILKLHRQGPDEVVCPGLLRFLENRKRENIYTILD